MQRLRAIQQQITPEQQHAEAIDPVASMKEERAKAAFQIRELTYLLDGGERNTRLKEQFMLEFERDPLFRMDDIFDISKDELRERTMEKFRSLVHHLSNESIDIFRKRMECVSMIDPGFWTRFGVHYGLFVGALQSNATSGQLGYWFQKGALSLGGMIGCFAMTELGHGSNVPGLETTATFDAAADQFVLHTPSLTATKWWIGGAAHSATHAAVFAQLIVQGKRYGTKCFVVPLRDPTTYHTLPGITIGDLGKKMGRDGIDNGYIQFTHVRIPRGYMLMKHTRVLRSGQVIEPKLQQLTYGALLQGRVAMVVDSGNVSKKALTIAIRYAAVRRQFSSAQSNIETKLLDYPIHQHRLMPLLAQTFAMLFTGTEMTSMYLEMMQRLENAKPGDKDLNQVLEMLKETHSTSAGLKAFCTWNCLNTIDQCRQACGGHGYSAYTGLANMYQDFAVQCTWEGDNTILALQLGRYLVSSYREARQDKKVLPPGIDYLNKQHRMDVHCTADADSEAWDDVSIIREGWHVVCAHAVHAATLEFEKGLESGLCMDDAYEQCSKSRLYAAKLHSYAYLFNRFADAVLKLQQGELREVLMQVCLLYGYYSIEENAGAFLLYEYFKPPQMQRVRRELDKLCELVRHQAIPLVDGFNLTDYMINSPLGRADGNVYVHYFSQVKQSNPQGPHPYFDRLIKPLISRSLIDQEESDDEQAGLESFSDDEDDDE